MGAAPRRRPAADRRIAERRKAIIAARVRRRRRILGWALAAMALAAGVAWLIRTPLFGLSAVRVDGTQAVAEAEVLEASKVRIGEPYLGLDLAAIRDRVAALPRVAAVQVTATTPPASASPSPSGRRWPASPAAACSGWSPPTAPCSTQRASRPADLPYVARVPLPDGVAGTRLPPGNELANALTALGGMAPQLKRQVAGVNARTLDSLEFTLKDGSAVLYGLAVDQPAKDAAVLLIRRTLKKEEGRRNESTSVIRRHRRFGRRPANNNVKLHQGS